MNKKVYHPLTQSTVDFGQTEEYQWATAFFKELMHKRKFALRLGHLAEEQAHYNLKPDITKKLLRGTISLSDIKGGKLTPEEISDCVSILSVEEVIELKKSLT